MRKEVVLAICIGLGLGLIITYGVYTANKATSAPQPENTNPPPPISTVPTKENLITLVSPADGDIFNTPIATLSGKAKANTQLIVLTESDDLVIKVDTDGNFNQTLKLVTGANLIQVTALNGDQRQDIKLNIVYTTTKYE